MLRRALAALALALLVAPASAHAMSKAQAERIARAKLHTPKSAVLHTISLAKGATVVEAGPGPQSPVKRGKVRSRFKPMKAKTWLVWEDLVPHALFEHPSVLLLIDDRTHKVTGRQDLSFFPLVNGKRPAFLKTAATTAQTAALPPNLSADCMITIGDRSDPLFAGDFTLSAQIASELKLARYEARSVADLEAQVRKAAARGCKDVMLVIAAHGFPAKGSNYKSPKSGHAVPESEHAQVQLAYTVSSPHTAPAVAGETLDATQLRALMNDHKDLTFKLVVSSCFAGRWLELSDVANLRVIAASSRRDQFSLGYLGPGEYTTTTQTDATFTDGTTTVTNATTNHTKASEFMNGILRGLDRWAHDDARASDDLAKGIADAFAHERDQDFATQRGMTNPQITDHSGTGTTGHTGPPQANLPPHGELILDHPTAKAGAGLGYEASYSDADGHVVKVQIDFGDGTTSDDPIGQHTYAAPGIYQVRMTVTDDDGATDTTDPQQVLVSGAGTKDAVITDAPCPGPLRLDVYIRIPSYADPPIAPSIAGTACGAAATIRSYEVTAGNDEGAVDEWGRQKNTLHVVVDIPGTGMSSGQLTVTAHWQ